MRGTLQLVGLGFVAFSLLISIGMGWEELRGHRKPTGDEWLRVFGAFALVLWLVTVVTTAGWLILNLIARLIHRL